MPPAATPAAVVDEAPAEPEPWESQEVVCDLLDEIVGLALDQLKEKERRAALVPFVVSAIEQQLAIGLKMFFIDHDIGEPEGAANWAPGEEPVPVPIDSWSRGAVMQRSKLPSPPPAPAPPTELVPGRTPQSPRVRTPGGPPSAAPLPPGAKEPIFVAKPPPGFEPPKVKKSAPVVTAAERKTKRLEKEAIQERERLERLKADMKGREYTYDARGNIIVMEPMAADKLPAFQQQPRLGLASEKANARRGKKAAGARAGRIDFGGSATFTQLDSLQPPVTDTMVVERGVLLREGESTKGGDARVFEGERVTRATFAEIANSSGGFAARRPVGSDAAAATRDPLGGSGPPATQVPPTPAKAGGASPPNPGGGPASPAARPSGMPVSPRPGDSHGVRNPSTRERGGMPTKTKLPPPSLGATTGHGQALPYAEPPGSVNDSVASSRVR